MLIGNFAPFGRLLAGTVISVSLAVLPAEAAEVAGEAIKVRPNASLKNPEGRVTLRIGMDVKMGDLVRTSRRGEAQLIFTDETKLVVGPGSSLVIESYLLRSRSRANNFTVRALSGTFRMVSGKSQKSAYKIRTPTATIGIRGTTFDMAVDRRNTDFFLYSGSAQLCTQSGCINAEPTCGIARASRIRGARYLENENDVINSLARKFPYFLSDEQLAPGFRVRATGCDDETRAKVAARARGRTRGMHENDDDGTGSKAPGGRERSGPANEPPDPFGN